MQNAKKLSSYIPTFVMIKRFIVYVFTFDGADLEDSRSIKNSIKTILLSLVLLVLVQ